MSDPLDPLDQVFKEKKEKAARKSVSRTLGHLAKAPGLEGVVRAGADVVLGQDAPTEEDKKRAGSFLKGSVAAGAEAAPRVAAGLAGAAGTALMGSGGPGDPLNALDELFASRKARGKDETFRFEMPANRSGGVLTPIPAVSEKHREAMSRNPDLMRASKLAYWAARGPVSAMERQVMGTASSAVDYERMKEATYQRIENPLMRQGIKSLFETWEGAAMPGGISWAKGVGTFTPEKRIEVLDKLRDYLDPYKTGPVTTWAMNQKALRHLAAEERGNFPAVWNSILEGVADFTGLLTTIKTGKFIMGFKPPGLREGIAMQGSWIKNAMEQSKHVAFAGTMAFLDSPFRDEHKQSSTWVGKELNKVSPEGAQRLSNALIRMAYMSTPIAARGVLKGWDPVAHKAVIGKEIAARMIDWVQNSLLSTGLVYHDILKSTGGEIGWEFWKAAAPSLTFDFLMSSTVGANWEGNKALWRSANYRIYDRAKAQGAAYTNQISKPEYHQKVVDGHRMWGDFITKKLVDFVGDPEQVARRLPGVTEYSTLMGDTPKDYEKLTMDEDGTLGREVGVDRREPGTVLVGADIAEKTQMAAGRSRVVETFKRIRPDSKMSLELFHAEFPDTIKERIYKILSPRDAERRETNLIRYLQSIENELHWHGGATDDRHQMVFYGKDLRVMSMEDLVRQMEVRDHSPYAVMFARTTEKGQEQGIKGEDGITRSPIEDMKETFMRVLQQDAEKDRVPRLQAEIAKVQGESEEEMYGPPGPTRAELVEGTKEEVSFLADGRRVLDPPGFQRREAVLMRLAGIPEDDYRFLADPDNKESSIRNSEMLRALTIEAMEGRLTDLEVAREVRELWLRNKEARGEAGRFRRLTTHEGFWWHYDRDNDRWYLEANPKSKFGKTSFIKEGLEAGIAIEHELTINPREQSYLKKEVFTGNVRINGRTVAFEDAEKVIRDQLRDTGRTYPGVKKDAQGNAINNSPLDDVRDILKPKGMGDYTIPRRWTTALLNEVRKLVRGAKAYIGQNKGLIENEVIIVKGSPVTKVGEDGRPVKGYETVGVGEGFVTVAEIGGEIKTPGITRRAANPLHVGKVTIGKSGAIILDSNAMDKYYQEYISGKKTPVPLVSNTRPLTKEQFFQTIVMHEFAHRVAGIGGSPVAENMCTVVALEMVGRGDVARLIESRSIEKGDRTVSEPIVVGAVERGTGSAYLDEQIYRTEHDQPRDVNGSGAAAEADFYARRNGLVDETNVEETKDDPFGGARESRSTEDRVKDAVVAGLKTKGIVDFITPSGERVPTAALDTETLMRFVQDSSQVPESVRQEVFEMSKFYLAGKEPVRGEESDPGMIAREVEEMTGFASENARTVSAGDMEVFGLSKGKGTVGTNPKQAIRDELLGTPLPGGGRTGGLKKELQAAIKANDKDMAKRILEDGYRHIHRSIGKFVGPSEKLGTAPPSMTSKMWNERKALTGPAKKAFGSEWVDKLEAEWGADYFTARQLAINWKKRLESLKQERAPREAIDTFNQKMEAEFQVLAGRIDPKYKDALLQEKDRVWNKMTQADKSGLIKDDHFGVPQGRAVNRITSPSKQAQDFNFFQRRYSNLMRLFGANMDDLERSPTFKGIAKWMRYTPPIWRDQRQEVVGMLTDMKRNDSYNATLGARAMDFILMELYEYDVRTHEGVRSLEGKEGEARQDRIRRLNALLPYVMEELHVNTGDAYGKYALSDSGRKHAWSSEKQMKANWASYKAMQKGAEDPATRKVDKEGKPIPGTGRWIPGLNPDWKPTLSEIKNFIRERPEQLYTRLCPTDVLNMAIWVKANVYNTTLKDMVSAGVLDNSNLYSNIKRGFMHRFWSKSEYERGFRMTSYSNAVAEQSPEAQKYETFAEFYHAAGTGEFVGEGGARLYVAEDFAMNTGDYVFQSMGRGYRQGKIIEPLKKMQNPQDPSLKLIEYSEDHTTPSQAGTGFLESKGYRQAPNAPGFADFTKGGYRKPWVHNSIQELIDHFTAPKGDGAVQGLGDALLRLNGMVKRNVMFSPNLFYLQIASTPLQWIPWRDKFTEVGKIASQEAVREGLRVGEERKEGQVESEFQRWQGRPVDPERFDLLAQAGLRGLGIRGEIMRALFDHGQTLKHPVLQTAHERTMEWMGSKGGVDQYVFTNMVGNIMFSFGDHMMRIFESKGFDKEKSAKLAAAFSNDTTGMLDPAIYGAEGRLLQMGLFSRDFTMSFLRMGTGALGLGPSEGLGGKLLNKAGLGYYQLGKRGLLNSLLHGEKTKADFDVLVPMYRLHLAKCFFNKWTITNMLQYGLSHLNPDPEERGVFAFQNPPGLRFAIRLPSSVTIPGFGQMSLLSPEHRWVHMLPLMFREADQMADIASDLPGLKQALGGRGSKDWIKSKLNFGMNILGSTLSEADYTGRPISGDAEVARIAERARDWGTYIARMTMPSFARGDIRHPLGGQTGAFYGQALGTPTRGGAMYEQGAPREDPFAGIVNDLTGRRMVQPQQWPGEYRDMQRVKRDEYERRKRQERAYTASKEEVLQWYIDGEPMRRTYQRKLYQDLGMPSTFWRWENRGAIQRQQQKEWEKMIDEADKKGLL